MDEHRPPPRPGPPQPPGPPPPPGKRSPLRTLAWVGCGCATLFLLVVGGGGAGAAYHLGWFSGSGAYDATTPGACDYVDTDLASGIATTLEHDPLVPAGSDGRLGACVLGAEPDDGGNALTLIASVVDADVHDLVRENGVERAEARLQEDFVDHFGLAAHTCDDGWPVFVGDDGRDAEYATGVAATRDSNLLLVVEVEANGAAGLDLGGRSDAARELLCAAVADTLGEDPPE